VSGWQSALIAGGAITAMYGLAWWSRRHRAAPRYTPRHLIEDVRHDVISYAQVAGSPPWELEEGEPWPGPDQPGHPARLAVNERGKSQHAAWAAERKRVVVAGPGWEGWPSGPGDSDIALPAFTDRLLAAAPDTVLASYGEGLIDGADVTALAGWSPAELAGLHDAPTVFDEGDWLAARLAEGQRWLDRELRQFGGGQ
jgi:hypothetical protein